jgi:hypothetical protein
MVAGFLTLAVGIYHRNTRHDRYAKDKDLNMQITDKISYQHDLHWMYDALIDNWSTSKFTLY